MHALLSPSHQSSVAQRCFVLWFSLCDWAPAPLSTWEWHLQSNQSMHTSQVFRGCRDRPIAFVSDHEGRIQAVYLHNRERCITLESQLANDLQSRNLTSVPHSFLFLPNPQSTACKIIDGLTSFATLLYAVTILWQSWPSRISETTKLLINRSHLHYSKNQQIQPPPFANGSVNASFKEKADATLTVFFIASSKEFWSSMFTPVCGGNSRSSTDLSDGAMAKMKSSTLRVNIVSLWEESFIPLGLYMWCWWYQMRPCGGGGAQHHDKLACNYQTTWIQWDGRLYMFGNRLSTHLSSLGDSDETSSAGYTYAKNG